jgi:catechol 2,3-dioxygenase-like lactoylglutathione lyase family enzyme
MHLNHIDLIVNDVQKTAEFFETYFDFSLTSSRTSHAIAILVNEEKNILVLQQRDEVVYPEGFHVGFVVHEKRQVFDQHERMKNCGIPISHVIDNARGVMFYCQMSEGYLIEVSCRN